MNTQTTATPVYTPDWVLVRLTAAAQALAGQTVDGQPSQIHVATGQMAYAFAGSAPQRVLRVAEWQRMLAFETANGQNLFELAGEAIPAVATAAAAATPATPTAEGTHAV